MKKKEQPRLCLAARVKWRHSQRLRKREREDELERVKVEKRRMLSSQRVRLSKLELIKGARTHSDESSLDLFAHFDNMQHNRLSLLDSEWNE